MYDQAPPPKAFHYMVPHSFCLASIIKVPPNPTQTNTAYHELVCTPKDQETIYELISTIGQNGKFSLLSKIFYLKELGASIDHVHPLKFLSTIFSNRYLKECMPGIFDDYFKRTSFMDGLAPNLTREADKGKLQQHVQPFALEVGVAPDQIQKYFNSRDWVELVRFLMRN